MPRRMAENIRAGRFKHKKLKSPNYPTPGSRGVDTAINRMQQTVGQGRQNLSFYGGILKSVNGKSLTVGKSVARASLRTAAIAPIVGAYGVYKAEQFRTGLMKGLYPGSAHPTGSGRTGARSNAQPAGMAGMRFSFNNRRP